MSRREQTGVVKRVFAERGFGFIRPDDGGDDIWFHLHGNGNARAAELAEGDAVVYQIAPGRDGRPQAERVHAAAGASGGAAGPASSTRDGPERGGGGLGGGWTAVGGRGGGREAGASGGRVAGGGEGGAGLAAAIALNEQIRDCTSAMELQEIVRERVSDFNNVNVATALYTLARLAKGEPRGARGQEQTIHALARKARQTAGAFNPQAVANTLWAYAKMGGSRARG